MYLYVVVQSRKKRLKIGFTKDLKRRVIDLSVDWGMFDLKNSFYVEGPSKLINCLEFVLLQGYKKQNMNYKKGNSGYTEFFKDTCVPSIKKVMKELNFVIKKIDFTITKADLSYRPWIK